MQVYPSKYAGILTALLLASLGAGCSDAPEPTVTEEPVVKAVKKADVMPPLSLDLLPQANQTQANQNTGAIDYIIDGSASMCGYFNAELNTTKHSLPMTKLLQSIQSVLRTNDRILVFMQDESSDKAQYIPFDVYENQLMQGKCALNGQYTELGLILHDYREQQELQQRSVVIVSDMHFLPAERTTFESQYDALLNHYLTPTDTKLALSNGILSLRAPFVGTYYTVNNATQLLEQTQKHLHFFWFTKQTNDAKQIEKIQQNIQDNQSQFPNSVIAQAEFLPQLKLLTDDAKSYDAFSSPAPIISPKNLLDLSSDTKKPFISAFDANSMLTEEQKSCYDLNWSTQAQNDIVFYPYPNSKTNRDKICADGPLFRSKTGSTLRLNMPLHDGYRVTPTAPDSVVVTEDYLSLPIVAAQGACIGVSSGMAEQQKTATNVALQYIADSRPINTHYYDQYSIERDGCSSESDCSNLIDKTFYYNQLISSLANKSKQHIDRLYPRTLTLNLTCDPDS